MRIKCPNCQNTMTFTLMFEDTDVYSITHTKEYKCKCGCIFEVSFIAEKPKILKKPIEENEDGNLKRWGSKC